MKRKASLETSTSEKSVKLERSDSPASSCVSLKTMDPPANFKEEFGLNLRVKQERSESPAPSCVSLRSMDPPLNFKEEFTPDSRVKQERSESPAPSCVSVRSMDPPMNFKEFEFTPDSRVKQERSQSPAPSCVSARSKDLPMNFKEEFTPDSRVKQERSESPAPSCVSVRSMDPPMNFKEEFTPDSSEFITSLLTEDHFRCTVCTDVLKDPVSIPCGHSYCKQCITSYWAQPNHAGHYACPQCSQSYSSHPALCTNSALAEVVLKLQQFSPVLPTHCYAGPGDVACDFCTGRKLRAVKSCLTCTASYCESHVRQHYTVPALQRHTLVEPTYISGHQDITDQWDIKTEDLKQAVLSHLEESLVENGNQRQLLKQQDIQTENLKLETASDRAVTQSQVMTAADLGMPISPRPQTEQQQQQTTEGPAMQPQQSTQQDLPSSQTVLQEKLCNDSDQNQKEMLEKQDRGVHCNSQDAATLQNSGDARRIKIQRRLLMASTGQMTMPGPQSSSSPSTPISSFRFRC